MVTMAVANNHQLNDAIKVIKKQDDSNKQLDEKIDRRTHDVNAFAAHIAPRWKCFERFCQPCGAVSIGTHQAAVSGFATVERDTDEDTVLLCHDHSMRPKQILDLYFKSCETDKY